MGKMRDDFEQLVIFVGAKLAKWSGLASDESAKRRYLGGMKPDKYYDEVVYGYDEANPCNDAQVPRSSTAVPVPLPTLRRIQCTDARPMHGCTHAHQCRPRPRARR